jgi:hypothetical protein
MSLSTLAYTRRAYKSFSRSARHLLQLIAGHQSLRPPVAAPEPVPPSHEHSRGRLARRVALWLFGGDPVPRRGPWS